MDHRQPPRCEPRLRSVTSLAIGLVVTTLSVGGAASAGAQTRPVAVCLENSLEISISYEYRWGLGSWSQDRLEAGEEVEHRIDLDARDGRVPWLQVRYQRQFGERDWRTVVRATPPGDADEKLECKSLFAELGPEELATVKAEKRRGARERWKKAAATADRELSSGIDLFFEVPRRDYSVVRVWKLGDERPVILGRASELREGPRKLPVALWGEGRYLVEILDEVKLLRLDSFVLDATARPDVTRLSPVLATP